MDSLKKNDYINEKYMLSLTDIFNSENDLVFIKANKNRVFINNVLSKISKFFTNDFIIFNKGIKLKKFSNTLFFAKIFNQSLIFYDSKSFDYCYFPYHLKKL